MLAHVDEGVGAEAGVEPPVEGEVVVGGRQVGGVVGADGVLAEAPGRLDGHHHVAEVDAGEDEVVVVDAHLARRRSPARLDLVAEGGGQGGEPLDVVVDGEAADGHRQLVGARATGGRR